MDVLAEFLPFLFVIVYVLLRALGGKARKVVQEANGQPDPASDGKPSGLDELTNYFEELTRATGFHVEGPAKRPKRIEPEFRSAEAPIHEDATFQHEQHGYGPDNPLSEESFERRPAFSTRTPLPDLTEAFDPHGLKRPGISPPPAAPDAPTWRRRLADPARAREAFVLKTILERRGGRRS